MKIRVVRPNGDAAVIDLAEPIEIHYGREGGMHRLSAGGMDHFFNQDGTYDGWGMTMPDGVEFPTIEAALSFAGKVADTINHRDEAKD